MVVVLFGGCFDWWWFCLLVVLFGGGFVWWWFCLVVVCLVVVLLGVVLVGGDGVCGGGGFGVADVCRGGGSVGNGMYDGDIF